MKYTNGEIERVLATLDPALDGHPPRSAPAHPPRTPRHRTRSSTPRRPRDASPVGLLEQIAARTERLPAERSTGLEHIKLSAWYLNIAVAGGQVSSLVVPMWTETWRAARRVPAR